MANVTNIRTITNNTPYPVTIKNGENTQQIFTVDALAGWEGEIWVPWIGSNEETWKAILVVGGLEGNLKLWIFQDYWNPPGTDAIKFCENSLNYQSAKEIQGNNKGGGDRGLILNTVSGEDIILAMI